MRSLRCLSESLSRGFGKPRWLSSSSPNSVRTSPKTRVEKSAANVEKFAADFFYIFWRLVLGAFLARTSRIFYCTTAYGFCQAIFSRKFFYFFSQNLLTRENKCDIMYLQGKESKNQVGMALR